MRLFICASILFAGCTVSDAPADSPIEVTGRLQNKSLNEASGLARSHRDNALLWLINDDGPAILHAIDAGGAERAAVKITKGKNHDWEDLASFRLNETAYLLVADIGDNFRRRDYVTLYVVEEPDADAADTAIAWRINFRYPDGPRDAESVAVDVTNQCILVLTKRDVPAQLYELPLTTASTETIVAKRLGSVATLPQPTQGEISNALIKQDWFWQPTGMDISPNAQAAVIVTNRGVHYYSRSEKEAWLDAFRRRPRSLRLGEYRRAEAIAIGHSGTVAFATVEKKHAPVLRIDLSGAIQQ